MADLVSFLVFYGNNLTLFNNGGGLLSSAILFIFNIVICDSIEIVFNCHSTLNFAKKKLYQLTI